MNTTDPMVGTRIRDARRAAGFTQARLADLVGVSRSAVAQWETGRTGQVGATLTRIADVLGVSAGILLEGTRSDSAVSDTNELALVRLFRNCTTEDRDFLLRTAVRLARFAETRVEVPRRTIRRKP